MNISSISLYEVIESLFKHFLALVIRKIKPFHVLKKDKASNIHNTLDLSTFIDYFSQLKSLSCRMGSYFMPRTLSSSSTSSNIVITRDMKPESCFAFDHFIIGVLILLKLFRVFEVNQGLIVAAGAKQVR